jgi:hypothetical protein
MTKIANMVTAGPNARVLTNIKVIISSKLLESLDYQCNSHGLEGFWKFFKRDSFCNHT